MHVLSLMAVDAQSDEVLCGVVSQHAAKFPVMDLQVSNRSAQLTSPSISLQYLFAKTVILFRIEFQSGLSLAQSAHGGIKLLSDLSAVNCLSYDSSSTPRLNISLALFL